MMMTKRTRGLSHLGDVCDFKLYRRLCWVRVVVLVLGAFFVCARNQTENVCSLQYFVLLVACLFFAAYEIKRNQTVACLLRAAALEVTTQLSDRQRVKTFWTVHFNSKNGRQRLIKGWLRYNPHVCVTERPCD